jgi:hypothetical protein
MKMGKRDWAIVLLIVAMVATNWVWYQTSRTQDTTNKNQSSAWLQDQVQINKLKACIDTNTHPCDITTTQ